MTDTMTSPSLDALLAGLVNSWCDRRALSPLRCLLAAYPMHMGTSDEWHELWTALRNVRGLNEGQLLEAERSQAEDALRLVDRAIRASGQVPTGPSA